MTKTASKPAATSPQTPPPPRVYESANINFEKTVLDAAKTAQRARSRQFRSVSSFINYHVAVALGLEAAE